MQYLVTNLWSGQVGFNAYLDAWLLALTAVVHLAGEGAIVNTVLHWAGRGRLIFCCMLEVKK